MNDMDSKLHKYTPEQLRFIEENIIKMSWKELTVKFNETFSTSLSHKALSATGKRYGIKSSRTGCFPKNNQPWNKGKKGISIGGKQTQFKKGHKPWNYMPVGSERVNADGYVDIKIADPNKWKGKHILIWEELHGPVPKGHAVIFADGNNRNFDPENLLLVSRKQLVRMNQRGLIKNDAELTKTGVIIADIYNKIGEAKRKSKERRDSH